MLDDFIAANRTAIIERSRARVAARKAPKPTDEELTHGVPVFLDQLGTALRLAAASGAPDHSQITETARLHGRDLLKMGLTISQVVHDYGDVCQSVTELAVELGAPISGAEFQTFNLCLDDAIVGAVTEYADQRERLASDLRTEQLGFLAHELRNLLNAAMLAFESMKSGRVGAAGSTGLVLNRSLIGIRHLIDRSLAEVRLESGNRRTLPIEVADFVEEVEVSALLEAKARGITFAVTCAPDPLAIQGDRQILAAALANLIQNAFKFTPKEANVSLNVRATSGRVLFEVEDECGGLPAGQAELLFRSFEQRGKDRSGLGLGLAIVQKAAKASGGELRVRDLPGKGCVFTLDLPRIESDRR